MRINGATKDLSTSPETEQKNALNNNVNNGNEVTNKRRSESTSEAPGLSEMNKMHFGSSRTLLQEEDRILKEMVGVDVKRMVESEDILMIICFCSNFILQNFPFATTTPMKDLAKFYRDCHNAPPLKSFSPIEFPENSLNGDAVNIAAAEEIFETEDIDNDVDALTKQLEQFETSLGDFDSLVSSLCSHSVDKNSNS